MRTKQIITFGPHLNTEQIRTLKAENPDLIFVFGNPEYFKHGLLGKYLKELFPATRIVGCSTAGEISGEGVFERSLVLTAVSFDSVRVEIAQISLDGMENSLQCGASLARSLVRPGLGYVFLLGPGLNINGSSLIRGMKGVLPANVPVTGGLAGDEGKFIRTYTLADEETSENKIIGIGFYGDDIQVSYSSFSGWQEFGVPRLVTRARENILYELDGEQALEVYKRYLGPYSKDLPFAGLLFPFSISEKGSSDDGVVRTILGINEKEGSLILAGEVRQNSHLRLMSSSINELVTGARKAAEHIRIPHQLRESNSLALLVSSVGRKLVMGERVEEEVETVSGILGSRVTLAGFYSNGEICPGFGGSCDSQLHNQTMTITYLSELPAA
jgi:hypothetical protein